MRADIRKAIAVLEELAVAAKVDELRAEARRLYQSSDAETKQAVIEWVCEKAYGSRAEVPVETRLVRLFISHLMAKRKRLATMDQE